MKTYANPSHHGINNTGERERAFTLTDLLVVMATLAILATVILPALAKSGDNGMRTVCLNNLRQMGTALNMYLTDDQDYMPWPNWGCDASPPCPAGWLYGGNPNSPNNLATGLANDTANWPTGRVANLKTSVYWQYLQNPDVFMCPVDAAVNVGTSSWEQRNNKLSTYCMNGASCFFPGTFGNLYGYKTAKASQIWSPLCIINWDTDVTRAFSFNDGANYPDSANGVSRLHVTGAPVLAVGGNSRFMSFTDFIAEMNHPLRNDNSTGKGLLWWNPLRRDGHGPAE